jgi:hypothetical protein
MEEVVPETSWYAFVSPWRLITYVYPPLPCSYDSAVYLLNNLMNNYRSKNEVIFVNHYRLRRRLNQG